MSYHYLFVPEHEPDEDVEYDLQHPHECIAGYGKEGPQYECSVQAELDAVGFDGLFDAQGTLLPGHWLIDAVYEVIPSGPWGGPEVTGGWVCMEMRKTIVGLEVTP